jgi:PAS domain S-box-containing protein
MPKISGVNTLNQSTIAQLVVDETPAIVAYVDNQQQYRFANKAYLNWFGREKEDILGLFMKDVIGAIYELNLPCIQGALHGSLQIFERKVVTPDGSIRYGLMTYKPNFSEGEVDGFFIHVADVTPLKTIEMELHAERENVKEVIDRELSSLRHTNKVLKHFGVICKEVTAQLSIQEITESLYNHVCQILDVSGFSIFFINVSDGALYPIFDVLDGQVMPLQDSYSPATESYLSRCISSKQTIIEGVDEGQANIAIDRFSRMSSVMATPLLNGDEVLGVMITRSRIEGAYGEREKLIFRALSTYAANTFVNANAYQQLQATKNKLVEQEKMASMGSMVSSLAHALNTPIGNSLLASTTVESGAQSLRQLLLSASLRKSDLERHIVNVDQASELTLANLRRAAKLIESFKHVAVDQSREQVQTFSVRELCNDVVLDVSARLVGRPIQVSLDIDGALEMHSYPHPLRVVLISLLDNAILHAYMDQQVGNLRIVVRETQHGRIAIDVSDDGIGIPDAILKKIFDPFFTTKMAHGCCGLGLNISYSNVTFVLEGGIDVESTIGVGTKFTLDLPMHVSNAI